MQHERVGGRIKENDRLPGDINNMLDLLHGFVLQQLQVFPVDKMVLIYSKHVYPKEGLLAISIIGSVNGLI